MRIETLVGTIAVKLVGGVLFLFLLFLLFAAGLTVWGMWELSHTPGPASGPASSAQQYQEMQRIINESESRIVNAGVVEKKEIIDKP